jgi:hypothetical protein
MKRAEEIGSWTATDRTVTSAALPLATLEHEDEVRGERTRTFRMQVTAQRIKRLVRKIYTVRRGCKANGVSRRKNERGSRGSVYLVD